jgi:ferredoxin-type protein NapH
MANKKNLRYIHIRKAMLLVSMLVFPVVLSYLSPYVIIMAASMGIVSGSALVFMGLLVSSLFFGRMWCGWLCPGGAVQEFAFGANDRRVNGKKLDWIKWVIWVVWLGLTLFLLINAGGILKVMPFIGTTMGISVLEFHMYVIYYGVLLLLVAPALLFGRRWMCHTFCWMAPFMIIGRRIANWLNLPGVRLKAYSDNCIACGRCTAVCPMSLEVQAMVLDRKTEHLECILCKSCVAVCPKDVLTVRVDRLT